MTAGIPLCSAIVMAWSLEAVVSHGRDLAGDLPDNRQGLVVFTPLASGAAGIEAVDICEQQQQVGIQLRGYEG